MSDEMLAAMRKALAEMGRSQSWLAAEVARYEDRPDPYSQAAVSDWLLGHAQMTPSQVFAAERALQLRPGTLSRMLGYLPATSRSVRSVPDAVAADPKLSAMGRRVVLAVYEELVDGGSDGS